MHAKHSMILVRSSMPRTSPYVRTWMLSTTIVVEIKLSIIDHTRGGHHQAADSCT
jgi:hypothetical protein